MPLSTPQKLQTRRPILQRVKVTETGFRFLFEHGPETLVLDTDHRGRELDAHVEYPLRHGWPSEFVRSHATEQVRRVLLARSLPNG
jgi:hypothetical protein